MKIILTTADGKHRLGTISGVERVELDDPVRLTVLLDEMRNIADRSELAPHTDAYTGATEPLPAITPPPLGRRLWNRFIWRTR